MIKEDKIQKLTQGFVLQDFERQPDGTMACVKQDFTTEDHVSYENDEGEPVDVDVEDDIYHPFDMVQPEIVGVDDMKIAEWSKKIAKEDGRPAHPEDYEDMAKKILKVKNSNVIWRRITLLANDEKSHTDTNFSFHDFWTMMMRFPL